MLPLYLKEECVLCAACFHVLAALVHTDASWLGATALHLVEAKAGSIEEG